MANDPKAPPPNRLVDPSVTDHEGQKTRVVVRNDIVDQTLRAPPGATPSTAMDSGMVEPTRQLGVPTAAAPPPGLLGKTRLIGGGNDALAGRLAAGFGGGGGGAGTMAGGSGLGGGGGGPAKTQYLRPGDMKADPVVGWLVVLKGPGRGSFRPVFSGMNSIGRDPGQRISIDFGDDTISREDHAFITYDDEQRVFYVQHGGKSNLVRLNKAPVLTPTQLNPSDVVRIGKTSLRFVPLCGPDFGWDDEAAED